ncbi:sensor histidine kinase [Corynebacterium sp. 35RC1]|nr:sensor histidine kinase [Corynebacterium sp. 35RC1]
MSVQSPTDASKFPQAAKSSRAARGFASMESAFLDYGFTTAAALAASAIYSQQGGREATYLLLAFACASWIWWRTAPGKLSVLLFTLCTLALWVTSDNLLALFPFWLAVIALMLEDLSKVAITSCVLVGCYAATMILGTSLTWVQELLNMASITLFLLAGLHLGGLVLRAREANAQLRQELTQARELTLADERARISAALHDGLGHHLTSIGLHIDVAQRTFPTSPERAEAQLKIARATCTQALQEMRSTVRALHPIALQEGSLSDALQAVSDTFKGTGLKVVTNIQIGTLSREVELLLLRITQEALTNTARHSGATKAHLSIHEAHGQVHFRLEDNGVATSEGSVITEGFGLKTLRERIEAQGGTLNLTANEQGAVLEANLK